MAVMEIQTGSVLGADRLRVTERRISPTDVSQYLRLQRCDRFLRLRLHERCAGRKFLPEFGVAAQGITPLLSLAGSAFEDEIIAAVRTRYAVADYTPATPAPVSKRAPDNERFASEARRLAPGETVIVYQPRFQVAIGAWSVRGDADLLRLERGEDGALDILVTDIKSSREPNVEHRLQVAFYQAMVAGLLDKAGVPVARFRTAILYRGVTDAEVADDDVSLREKRNRHRADASALFAAPSAFLEIVADGDAYLAEAQSLVLGENSEAARVAVRPFDSLFYTLGVKCDGCLYNEFCMKDTHARGDLSLTPCLSGRDKKALLGAGVAGVADLARLKEFARDEGTDLVSAPGLDTTVRKLSATTAGPRLDELVLRARRTRLVKDLGLRTLPFIPSKGHSTLPYSDEKMHPNLVRVFIDFQQDYQHRRTYLAGALVVANENGVTTRRQSIVHLTNDAPDTPQKEAALLGAWARETLDAVVSLAQTDDQNRAPIHLVFWNDAGERALLDTLARCFPAMTETAPALYDFVTQMAAFDSPVATFLDQEIRERRNYPMVCQSLHAVAAYLRFPWNDEETGGPDFRKLFHERLFDAGGKSEFERGADTDTPEMVEEAYGRRSRHSSQIPLEYAHAAWGTLPAPDAHNDLFVRFRHVTRADLLAFQAKRLEAVERIADDIPANKLSEKTPFTLPDLATFTEKAPHMARALEEFLTIERHVTLDAWRTGRLLPPERRVLQGETLLVRYVEDDQGAGVAEWNRDNAERKILRDRYYAEYKAANPGKARVTLPKAQADECKWAMTDMPLRLRLDLAGVDADLETIVGLLNVKDDARFILYPRWSFDERLPEADRTPNTPTPKQMLYGMRVTVHRVRIERDDAGWALSAVVEATVCRPGGASGAYLFSAIDRPLEPNGVYTLDPDPNDIYGLWQRKVADSLCALEAQGRTGAHTLYWRIVNADLSGPTDWNTDADAGQGRFLAGLLAYEQAGLLHDFEPDKRAYIGAHGGDPILLVQGPPGTGKSYSTAFALLARMQGAMTAKIPLRAFLSCKTHSATDVLIKGVAEAIGELARLKSLRPDLWNAYFDDRLLDLPLLRLAGGGRDLPSRIQRVQKDAEREKGDGKTADEIGAESRVVVATTPGGVYSLASAKSKDNLHASNTLCDLLILDEASQMSLPEAMMASLPLAPGGRLIVVGDPRQMPPIVQHAWENEPRRTFQSFRSYESLFAALASLNPPFLRFSESFRLHGALAKFLRDEVYIHDGIPYHSRRRGVLPAKDYADPFVQAVLSPDYPLIVVVHDEASSQARNRFEETLIGPVLRALALGGDADPETIGHGLDARTGMGVVVPHRAQRAGLRQAYPELCVIDQDTGEITLTAVDTVERYQGDERNVIVVSATESDPEYLQASASFLLDPRRLTVALSRAKQKMVLVASRAIFNYFTSDEELFASALVWKNLLRRACVNKLYEGAHGGDAGGGVGTRVEVWGGSDC